MRRRIKRSSLFTMIAVVALLSLGIGYAAWTASLTINSTVSTANAAVEITAFDASESADPLGIGTCAPDGPFTATSAAYTITNAYPGYACTISLTVLNSGDVPMEITDVVFSPLLDISLGSNQYQSSARPGMTVDFTACQVLDVGDVLIAGQDDTCVTVVSFDTNALPGNAGYGGSVTFSFEMP